MRNFHSFRFLTRVAAVAAGLLAIPAVAQQEVNPQANNATQNAQPAAGQRVNGELYGNTGPSQPLRHYQSTLLPSEQRYIIERSGATPSELRAQANRVGPLSPEGPLAYIPLQSSLQRALGVPQLQLVNPAYGNDLTPRVPQALPPPGSPDSVQPGLVRPTEPAPSPNFIRPQRVDAGQLVTPPMVGSTGTGEGTVTFRLPTAARPTTVPTTQPSLGERR